MDRTFTCKSKTCPFNGIEQTVPEPQVKGYACAGCKTPVVWPSDDAPATPSKTTTPSKASDTAPAPSSATT